MYADVILPLPLSEKFTYKIPEALVSQIHKGTRVIVPFGKSKTYVAIVSRIHSEKPQAFLPKEIHSRIDSAPLIDEKALAFWEWISFYYMAPVGDVYKAALPSLLQTENKAKTEIFIRLNPEKIIFAKAVIGNAKKQQALFEEIQLIFKKNKCAAISKKRLLSLCGFSSAVLNGLIQKEVVILFEKEISRIESPPVSKPINTLNLFQSKALEEINTIFDKKNNCLLHGITSSGKTEIYIHLIAETIKKGKQALYLVPEIALTAQLTHRLQAVFGKKLGIYHSKINDQVRAEIWQKMHSKNPFDVIIGVRSSIFLPFRALGLVIIDEEHEPSYKQQDPSPRYHARDAAIVLAQIHGASVLLGSATPAIESFYNALTGKYGLVSLTKRFEEKEMPEITLVNTKELRRKRKMKSILSPDLIDKIWEALSDKQQVMLFRNRRGFAPIMECNACGWIPKCHRCDVALTYHKKQHRMQCHYCNAWYSVLHVCPACHEEKLTFYGQGTEQIENVVAELFPKAKIARMDTDTTRAKSSYEKIINDFEQKKTDILVGTQMLAKGLDFNNVRVVGIISADSLLNHPDFRAHERGFQLMTQAAGRSGRKHTQGSVIIQTAEPEQPIFDAIVTNNYRLFFDTQLSERKIFHYPPFFRLISIILKHKREILVQEAAQSFAHALKKELGERVLGANTPPIAKIQHYHLQTIMLKIEKGFSVTEIRRIILAKEKKLRENSKFKYVTIHFDVDPV